MRTDRRAPDDLPPLDIPLDIPLDPDARDRSARAGRSLRSPSAEAEWLPLGPWLAVAGVALLVVLGLGALAVSRIPQGAVLSIWWPAAGIAVAVLAATPPRWRAWFLVAYAVAGAASGIAGGRDVEVSLLLSLAATAEAALVIALLTRRGRRARLGSIDDLGQLVVATVAGAIPMGLAAGAVLSLTVGADFWSTARAIAASHGAAVLLIGPLGMQMPPHAGRASRAERVLHLTAVTLAFAALYAPYQPLPLTFLPIPLLVWSAMRLPLRLVSVELVIAGSTTALLTATGHGPFAFDLEADDFSADFLTALVQIYLVCIALVMLPLAVTVQQRLEALAQAVRSEDMFRRGFRDSLIGMLLLRDSPEGLVIEELNARAEVLLGRDGLRGEAWGDLLRPEDRDEMQAAAAELRSGARGGWTREVALGAHGERTTRVAMSPLLRPQGEQMYVVQVVDLSGERLAQRRLEQQVEFTDAVIDTTATLIVVVDRDGAIARFNPAAERLSGHPADDVRGRPVWDVVGSSLGARIRERLRPDADPDFPHTVEAEWVVATGDRRTVSWSCAFLDPDNSESPLVMTGVDVTAERSAQSLFQDVFAATTGTSIIGTGPDGVITFFNVGAENLLGWRAEEVVGIRKPSFFHDPDEVQDYRAQMAEIGPGASSEKRDYNYVRKDGRRITMALQVSAMTSASGAMVGYLGVAEDVTERARAEAALRDALATEREALERLHELDRSKGDFVSSVSHELRTPITSVLGYTQMLQRGSGGGLTERQAKLLGRVESNALRLQDLIEDLLTLSRIESGTFVLSPGPVDLREVVARAAEATETMRHEKPLTWHVEVGARPIVVRGDADQLERAVINLMSNAIKFTPVGGQVDTELWVEHAEDGGTAVVRVSDTGMGIPLREQEQLFARFFRSVAAQRRAIPGTGLGLSIVRSIADAHQGTITLRSAEGQGSSFELRLPLSGAGAAAPRPGG